MVENFEGVLKKEWYREDLKALTSQIKEHESLLRLKRRWLMDLPLFMSEQKRVDEMLPLSDKILPESLLREDDVSYEDIKSCIEVGFGARKYNDRPHSNEEEIEVFNPRNLFRDILSLVDDMTNNGLHNLLKILTDGTSKFEKTNWSMKRTIRQLLPKLIADKNAISKIQSKQLSQLLKDPKNFHGAHTTTSIVPSEAYRAAAVKLLDGLEDFPSRTLTAMHRKLKGVTGHIPSVAPTRSGRARDSLVNTVRKMCMKMVSDIGEVNEPSERLTGALGVAGLTLKLLMNRPEIINFRKFSPEVEALQNDVAKAIHLLNDPKKVSIIELKKVQVLLDPDSKLSIRSLRMGVRNLLTEYLFECSGTEDIPDYLVEILDIINRKSCKRYSTLKRRASPQELMNELIQKEVECVLAVSSQAKEVVLNLLPEHEFDEEFNRAYVEDFEGSNAFSDSDDDTGNNSPSYDCSYNSCSETESIGETNPAEVSLPLVLGSKHVPKTESDEICGLSPLSHSPALNSSQKTPKTEETKTAGQQSMYGNQYLEVQEACDATSMTAYHFVGEMLDKIAKMEGIVLYQGDRLYLRHYLSDLEDLEESPQTLSTSELVGMWENALRR